MRVDINKFSREHLLRQFFGAVLLAQPEVQDTVKTSLFDVRLSVNDVEITNLSQVIVLLLRDVSNLTNVVNRFPLLALVLGNRRKGVGSFVPTETAVWAKVVDERVVTTWSFTSAQSAKRYLDEGRTFLANALRVLESNPTEAESSVRSAQILLNAAMAQLPA